MKLKYGILIISGLFLFLNFSCTKFGKNVTVKGRVLNPITGEGIAGAEIWLQKTTLGLPGGLKTVKKVTSSADGSFELNKFGLVGYSAICVVGDRYPLGWTQDGGASFTGNFTLDVKKGKVMHADYYAVPYGEIQWHLKNINCEGSTDSMWYKIKHQYENDFLSIWSFPYIGCSDIISNGTDKLKMGKHIIYLKIKRPSGLIYKYDTVFVDKNGITNFDIFY